ncbi:MAG: helix-turn-helix domain-containing protein [Saprospiraceae bacterium]|nr:helix-turn-helix domain-containing protein [Saprospiraceae bacterium]
MAIIKLTGQDGKLPTQRQLAAETGLSRKTIGKHLKGLKREN